MEKVLWKGGAMLAPVPPVLVTCGQGESANVLTVGWTGILNTQPPMTYISVRPGRHSFGLIRQTGEFVINLTTEQLVPAADFCGVRSGREVDKFAACRLAVQPASQVAPPLLAQSPVHLECRVVQQIPLGSHEMFMAEIVAVQVDAALVDSQGALHLERAHLAAYAHGGYYALGRQLGRFGFSVRRRKQVAQGGGKRPSPPGGQEGRGKDGPGKKRNFGKKD